MAENTVKVKQQQREEKKNLFSMMGSAIKVDKIFEEGLPVKYLPYVLYITGIIIFYIGNTHYSDKTIRRIGKLKAEVDDLRADYTTLKADLMYYSKQSEVAKKVSQLGLEESSVPPFKIILKDGEY
jgi:hypothetical protein